MEYRDVILTSEKTKTKEFLEKFSLNYESDIEHTINCIDEGMVIATISCAKNIIKCMAIDETYQGQNIAGTLISKMIHYLHTNNVDSVFVFTKPSNKDIFLNMSFSLIVETKEVCLLEMFSNISEELDKLKKQYNLFKNYAAIVVNCNPMTNGHLYLIEKCASENENVIVFVVEEDRSEFKFSDRFKIVTKECEKFSNVVVVPSTKYIISQATFPTYFLKDEIDVDEVGMEVDLTIFEKYFVPAFNISARYVGTEPYNVLTENYNTAMKKYLTNLVEIERVKDEDIYISATKVRELIAEKDYERIKSLVPESTYQLIINN